MSSPRGRIYGCICSEACFPFERPLTVWAGPYMYLLTAYNGVKPLQSRLPGVKQMVVAPQSRVSVSCPSRFVSSRTHRPYVVAPFTSSLMAYSIWDYGHGGTRNRSISPSAHTWSVNPAAIIGFLPKVCEMAQRVFQAA